MIKTSKERLDQPPIPAAPVTQRIKPNLPKIPKPEVAVLGNSLLWGLRRVLILHINQDYRLIAIFKNTILCDQIFPSLNKTKRTFTTRFKNRRWRPGLKPSWGDFIPLEPKWLDQVSKTLAKPNSNLETFNENDDAKEPGGTIQINAEK